MNAAIINGMHEIDSAPDEQREIFLRCGRPFYFDPEKLVFLVGEKGSQDIVKPTDVERIYDFDCWPPKAKENVSLDIPEALMIAASYTDLVATHSMRKWLVGLDADRKDAVLRKVEGVIQTVHKIVDPLVEIPTGRGGHIVISATFDQYGILRLQTFGDCACLGRNPDPYTFHGPEHPRLDDLEVPIQYAGHNIDTPAQGLSLYAGAGTLGWIARTEQGLRR